MKRSLLALTAVVVSLGGCAGPAPELAPAVPDYRAESVTIARMEDPGDGASTVAPEVLALFEKSLRRELEARGFRRGADLTIRYRVRDYAAGGDGPPEPGIGETSARSRLWVEALYVARDGRPLSMVRFRQRRETRALRGEDLIVRAAAHIARNARRRFR